VNQRPASARLTQARATRDILSRWRAAHIHVRRPSGVHLFSRVTASQRWEWNAKSGPINSNGQGNTIAEGAIAAATAESSVE